MNRGSNYPRLTSKKSIVSISLKFLGSSSSTTLEFHVCTAMPSLCSIRNWTQALIHASPLSTTQAPNVSLAVLLPFLLWDSYCLIYWYAWKYYTFPEAFISLHFLFCNFQTGCFHLEYSSLLDDFHLLLLIWCWVSQVSASIKLPWCFLLTMTMKFLMPICFD